MVNIRSRIGWNSRAAGRTWPTRLWVKTLVPGWYPKSQSHSWLMDVYSPDRRCPRMEWTRHEIKIVCAHQRPIERQLRRRNDRVIGFHQGFTPNPKGPETSVDPRAPQRMPGRNAGAWGVWYQTIPWLRNVCKVPGGHPVPLQPWIWGEPPVPSGHIA